MRPAPQWGKRFLAVLTLGDRAEPGTAEDRNDHDPRRTEETMDDTPAAKPRDLKFVIVGLAVFLAAVGGKMLLDRATDDPKPEAASATATPIAPTTLLPMVTTNPYHEKPDTAEWRVWLKANEEPFSKAKAKLAASQSGEPGRVDNADVAQWSALLLARPIPADPIGQRLTASMTAIHEAAVTNEGDQQTQPVLEAVIKGDTLLQSALADLQQLGVLASP